MPAFKNKEVLKPAVEAQNSVRAQLDAMKAVSHAALPPAAFMCAIEKNSAIQQMVAAIEHQEVANRTAITSMVEELRRVHTFSIDSVWHREAKRTMEFLANLEMQFRLPDITHMGRLMEEFRKPPFQDILAIQAEQHRTLQLAIEGMRTPWPNKMEAMPSLAAFQELQGIGQALKAMPAFSETLTAALRMDLGDWRDHIAFPPDIFKDLTIRSDFYASLGFNHALTEFPSPAFRKGLERAGIRRQPPPIMAHYGPPVPVSGDNKQEKGFVRTNTAHDWLQRLETQLRAFIDRQMTQSFGMDWPRHRLPNGLYDIWLEKKRKALNSGAKEWPLISYADFADYERVICKADNWKTVFVTFFGRPETVRESFQRLYPIRLDTMHARPISQDDELLLYVETRRLVKVILPLH